jgi:hypothetical protein
MISSSVVTFLNLRHLPARLTTEQIAAVLGFHPDHIPLLVCGKLLKPLGNPAKNGVKLFATAEALEKAKDLEWLDKATKFLTKYWQIKNNRRSVCTGADEIAKHAP